MTPEQQVPTLETCNKLKDLGIEIDSYFSWVSNDADYYGNSVTLVLASKDYGVEWEKIPAPTVEELLELMPGGIIHDEGECLLETSHLGKHGVYYEPSDIEFEHDNFAEALAQMLIWLKEKGYL